jgi:hypothetical protein
VIAAVGGARGRAAAVRARGAQVVRVVQVGVVARAARGGCAQVGLVGWSAVGCGGQSERVVRLVWVVGEGEWWKRECGIGVWWSGWAELVGSQAKVY